MFPPRNISWKKMQVLKTQSFTHEVSYHRASACLSKAKREIQEGRTFYKQSRESGYRNDREMNQAGIVWKRLEHRMVSQTLVNIYKEEWSTSDCLAVVRTANGRDAGGKGSGWQNSVANEPRRAQYS